MATDGSNKRSQSSSSIPPRKINVLKFAAARATELESLHSTISNRLNNDFRSRRNKRRRTTAHDKQAAKRRQGKRPRLGALIDKSNALDSEKDQKKAPRRIRRRIELRKNPESGFSTSGDGTKRLRTHVWHAKRFTMAKRWGFHLPLGLQGRGRGSRAVLKCFKHGVLVHDASYYVPLQLEGPEDSLISILEMVMVPSPSVQSEDISHSVLSGVTYGSAMLHHIGAPCSQPIAPVTYMWRPSQILDRVDDHQGLSLGASGSHNSDSCSRFRQLWVWIHASAFCEGFDTLKFACQNQRNEKAMWANCFSLEGQLGMLVIIGLKAFQLLQKTLHPVSCNSENHRELQKCSASKTVVDSPIGNFSKLKTEEHIPSSAILSLTVKDPRTLPDKRLLDVPESLRSIPEVQAKQYVTLSGHSEKSEEILSSSWPKPEGISNLSDEKTLWDASSGFSPPEEENVLCMEKNHQLMDFLCLDGPKSGMLKTSNKVQCSRSCPILLLKNNNQKGSPIGWSIILPLNWIKVFWVTFVSKGAHAMGLREKHWVACEIGLPYFPSDFPDCGAYSSFMATEAAASEQKAERRPPALRPFRVPIPPPWDSVRIPLEKVSAGVQDTEASSEKNMVDGNLLSNLCSGKSDVTPSSCHDNSFNRFVARRSTMLSSFLNDIHGDHLLLFPHVPNGNTSCLRFMKDEDMLSQGQKWVSQINYDHKLCFLRVLLHAYKEGVFEDGAVVCAPFSSDISLWTSSSLSTCGGLTIPEFSVRSYFQEQSSGEWELNMPEDPTISKSHRLPIGFVTTGFVHGSKKPTAEAFCEAVLLARLREEQWNNLPVKRRRKEIYVLVRNLRSTAYRLALATIVLEQQEEDILCM